MEHLTLTHGSAVGGEGAEIVEGSRDVFDSSPAIPIKPKTFNLDPGGDVAVSLNDTVAFDSFL